MIRRILNWLDSSSSPNPYDIQRELESIHAKADADVKRSDKRDAIALEAMKLYFNRRENIFFVARNAYILADAMLKARDAKEPESPPDGDWEYIDKMDTDQVY